MSSSKRHFTAVVGSKEHGLYISASPSSAARKIVSKLCASSKSKKVEFCVREITQGSKKKTYGPYLGEMKKLAKPIELKGRVIRFDIKVHLKKKKTATKTAKKVGKKMRGGTITDGGELDKDDFIISGYLEKYNSIEPCKLTIKNDRFQEPFIFFGKKINENTKGTKTPFNPSKLIHYKYVAFNYGKIFGKKARFNVLSIDANFNYNNKIYERLYFIADISIENIPKDDLIQLNEFIERERERLQNSLFCKTIYNAVIKELYLRKNNTDTMFYREINKIEDHEKKIRLIQPDKQDQYRQLLVSINVMKKKLVSNNSYKNKSGQNRYTSPDNTTTIRIRNELNAFVRQKEDIERRFSA